MLQRKKERMKDCEMIIALNTHFHGALGILEPNTESNRVKERERERERRKVEIMPHAFQLISQFINQTARGESLFHVFQNSTSSTIMLYSLCVCAPYRSSDAFFTNTRSRFLVYRHSSLSGVLQEPMVRTSQQDDTW